MVELHIMVRRPEHLVRYFHVSRTDAGTFEPIYVGLPRHSGPLKWDSSGSELIFLIAAERINPDPIIFYFTFISSLYSFNHSQLCRYIRLRFSKVEHIKPRQRRCVTHAPLPVVQAATNLKGVVLISESLVWESFS